MEQSINLFRDNSNLTNLNSLTHLLDFDDNYNDLAKSIQPSMYYSEDGFMAKSNINSCIIMNLDCQSLHAKFSRIKLLVDTFAENETPIQVLCLQETWFENSNNIDLGLYHIDNYHFVTKNRYASAHGGLAFYIHSNWNYKVKSDTVDSPYLEEMYIEIYDSTNLKCKFTVGNMYRPPHTATAQLSSFVDYFTDRLSLLNIRETTVVCGDFNINLLSINSNEHYNAFFVDTLSSCFLPIITLPIVQ